MHLGNVELLSQVTREQPIKALMNQQVHQLFKP